MADRFPRAYTNTVPKVSGGSDTPPMEYTTFNKMGIGARSSGLPNSASDGPRGLDHVGGNASGGGKK